ncbi:MAG TPA: hypothetical protein ENK91_13175, partial [Bacteroidetes bacterium]|nr:hypothetical protein [Bacteroidota bacterium]
MKKSLFLFLLLSQIIVAQNLSVLSNEKVLDSDSKYYYPHLSPDGQKIAFTTQNFTGLYVIDIKTNKITQISDKPGAGYEPAFSNDGNTLYFRTNEYEGIKKYSSLLSYNMENNNKTIIVQRKRDLLPPKIINGKLIYTVKGEIQKKKIGGRNNDSQKEEILAFLENQKITLIKDGQKTVLAPLGDGNYIWPQLSPDKTKLMFTFAGHGTYISDLDGNILAELGYLNASKWLNNDWVVGMKDRDNGDIFTASEIFAVKADGQKAVQLTDT